MTFEDPRDPGHEPPACRTCDGEGRVWRTLGGALYTLEEPPPPLDERDGDEPAPCPDCDGTGSASAC